MIDFFIVEEPFDSQKHSENVGEKKILNVVFWTLQEQNIWLDLNIWNEMFLHSVFSFVEDGIVRLSTYSTSSEGCTVKCNLESEVFGENSI